MSISSLDKTLHYMNCASKGNHKLSFAGNNYEMTASNEFIIRTSMFFKDECISCGQCCRNYDTIMFPTDLDEIKRKSDAGQEQYKFYLDNCAELPIIVDGKEYKYYSVPPMTSKDSHDIWTNGNTSLNCRWIFLKDNKKYCRIHEYRCITCGFPHMEMWTNPSRNSGFLGHKQFGRNFRLGCQVDIKRPLDQETLNDNIYWLERLNIVANYFNIDTYLPEVINFLKTVDVNNPPKYDIVFSKSSSKKLFTI